MQLEQKAPRPAQEPATALELKQSWGMVIVAAALTLFTYQAFHHGLWGKLVNYNKTPKLTLSGTRLTTRDLSLDIYRPNGPDTYGSFVVQVALTEPGRATPVEVWGPKALAALPATAIRNRYHFQQVKEGPWGLVVPLSAQARVTLPLSPAAARVLAGSRQATVTVEDVSGLHWQTTVPVR
ncbi:Thiosulfate dehydrogenase [quinone] small subunit [Candidatus Hydrogenisulfobacillus filiaventi]|uniref:Thiosulfate dehydrogenase [quinone] small subunit n=1 Tax=Candidatus Hydrogenisulfobacillus filiaventi TaxID=2707344 RepID=A0A6F8ZJW1_9FIRM|nr:hypothetical protein [Bacillota bacterium]CAB1130050.1 Thiosulfate dehydrogenase [quinone] small subunit [Candidatus Hydrogenisulfobacillus filiaventi]